MSPEVAVRPPWRNLFQSSFFKENLALIAVDEAHCIAEWFGLIIVYAILLSRPYRGSDFRTCFRSIGGLRALTNAPLMALSASASPSVVKYIADSLHLRAPVEILHSLDRPNIYFSYGVSKGLAVS